VPEDVETVDGIPLGDCREPTADELSEQGCPAAAPEGYAACTQSNLSCSYGTSSSAGYALQDNFYCYNSQWSKSQTVCGYGCQGRFEYEIDFTADCADRELIDCVERSNTTYSNPSSQSYLDEVVGLIVMECGGELTYRYMQFEFIDGCPTHATFDHEQTPEFLECLSEALGNAKLSCAINLTCSNQGITPL
jgi:hypothetical protein